MKFGRLWKLSLLGVFIIFSFLVGIFTSFVGNDELRWIFAAASQSIAALVAFLLAGYAIFINDLNSLREKDQTLEEIGESIKGKSFRRLKNIFWFSFLSIGFSLFSIIFTLEQRNFVIFFLHGLTLSLVFWTLYLVYIFIQELINPGKIPNTAKEMLRGLNLESRDGIKGDKISKFLMLFRNLEMQLIGYANRRYPGKEWSLQKIATMMFREMLIQNSLYVNLRRMIKLRNLVAHSDIQEVSHEDYELLERTLRDIKAIVG